MVSDARLMSLPTLRPMFGDLAGGLEHAVALATLAYATTRRTGLRLLEPTHAGWFDAGYPAEEEEREHRLLIVLHALMAEAGCTVEELRQEGFSERVLAAITGTAPPTGAGGGSSVPSA